MFQLFLPVTSSTYIHFYTCEGLLLTIDYQFNTKALVPAALGRGFIENSTYVKKLFIWTERVIVLLNGKPVFIFPVSFLPVNALQGGSRILISKLEKYHLFFLKWEMDNELSLSCPEITVHVLVVLLSSIYH